MAFLLSRDRIAGVMGGHDEERGSDRYKAIFEISRQLTKQGFLMASGGGPGAMEATHLGALLASSPYDFVRRSTTLNEDGSFRR
jgi:predicted Rossmann-fold nucleotide-binding protein